MLAPSSLPPATVHWAVGGTLAFTFAAVVVFVFKSGKESLRNPSENFFTGTRTQQWWRLGFSWFAGLMGTWVLTGPVETAYYDGWYAALGYALSCALPFFFFVWAGPRVVEAVDWKGFTVLHYVKLRFGRGLAGTLGCVAVVSTWLGQIADMTAITFCVQSLSTDYPPVLATLATGIVTVGYTLLGGFQVSVLTDLAQGVVVIVLVTTTVSALFLTVEPALPPAALPDANTWETSGLMTGAVLMVSVFFVTFTDLAFWQKSFAAENPQQISRGLLFAVVLTLPVMVLFGSVGFLLRAAEAADLIEAESPSAGFFALVSLLPRPYLVAVIILTVCLACSSLDSRVNAISNLAGPLLTSRGINLNWSRIFGLFVNLAAAVVVIFEPPSVMTLLFLTNIIGQVTAPTFFLGLWPGATQLGCLCGIAAGFLSVAVIGWSTLGTFVGGFQWFLFPLGWGNWQCLLTFIIAPVVTVGVAVVVSLLETHLSPNAKLNNEEKIRRLGGSPSLAATSQPTEMTTEATTEMTV